MKEYATGAAMLLMLFCGFAGGAIYGANQSAKSIEARCGTSVVQLPGGSYYCQRINSTAQQVAK